MDGLNNYSAVLLFVLFSVLELSTVWCQNTTLSATSTTAYFTSDGYPTAYSNNVTYTWLLESNDLNEVVKIEVVDCQIEYINAKVPVCQLDILTIYDGAYDNATQLYSSCCITSVPAMNSSGTYLLVKFTTDTTVVARGFRIKYYNTAASADTTVAAASSIFIAVGVVVVLIVGGAFIAAYFVYKLKCQDGTKQRINPQGAEGHSGIEDNAHGVDSNAFTGQYEKQPLEGTDYPAPPPKPWTEEGGMKDPDLENTERNVFVKESFPTTQPKKKMLPPLKNATISTTNQMSGSDPQRSISPVG